MKKHGTAKRVRSIQLVLLAIAVFVGLTAMPAESRGPEASATVESLYPGLASGVLTHARFGDLPGATLLRSGCVVIIADELNSEVLRAPETLQVS